MIVPVIRLRTAEVELWPDSVRTLLPSGGVVPAAPENDPEYRARARALGYGDDTLAMCRDHELIHSWLADLLSLPESPVLAAVARGEPLSEEDAEAEECAVLGLQRLCRQHGVDLPALLMERG